MDLFRDASGAARRAWVEARAFAALSRAGALGSGSLRNTRHGSKPAASA